MRTPFLVADGDALVRSTVGPVLARRCSLRVVAEAADVSGARLALARHRPALALVAADLPGGGLELCGEVTASEAAVRIVVLGDGEDGRGVLAALERGADGFVDRRQPLAEVADAVVTVLAGQAYVPPGTLAPVLRRLIRRNREADRVLHRFMNLTRRERQIVELLADGCDVAAVAEILVISPQTARTHIQNVISKLGVHSRLEVAALVHEHGLLDRLLRKGA